MHVSPTDSGHWTYDTCDRNDRRFRYPIRNGRQNIGSADRPFPELEDDAGCIRSDQLIARPPRAAAVECIWSDRPFRGWQGESQAGATPYRRYLAEAGEFGVPR